MAPRRRDSLFAPRSVSSGLGRAACSPTVRSSSEQTTDPAGAAATEHVGTAGALSAENLCSPECEARAARSSSLPMRTTHVKAVDVEDRWLLFDASKHPLGRMAARIARSLIGKDRPTYTPSEHGGTHVVVIHAERTRLSGTKGTDKLYQRYSGYPSGRREITIERMRERRPADIVMLAVRRMLPKNRLGRDMLRHLKVYAGGEHPHRAQKPVVVEKL